MAQDEMPLSRVDGLSKIDQQSELPRHATGLPASSAPEKYTPGPWRLWLSDSDHGAFVLHADSSHPHGENMVITKRDCGTPNGAEGVANARLIAAAPELLEACRVAEEVLDGALSTPARMAALRALQDAIAKAEGR